MAKSTSNAAKQLGSKGGKKGGPSRAKKLSSQQRSEIAKKGGKAKAAKK
jgi:general stress protein YciG